MSRFIEDEVPKPKPGRQVGRWFLVVVMLACVYLIGAGLYAMKHGDYLPGIREMIAGSFFFLVSYAVYWLLRN